MVSGFNHKNIKVRFKTVLTKNLSKHLIKNIIYLKMEHYKYNFNNQYKWFKKNIQNMDKHNLALFKNEIIGYTCLRQKKILIGRKKILKILLFDTCVVKKKKRNAGIGTKLMNYNNKIISKSKKPSLLLCKQKLIKFYKKFNWKNIKKSKVLFVDHKQNKLFIMSYKFTKKINGKILVYLNS